MTSVVGQPRDTVDRRRPAAAPPPGARDRVECPPGPAACRRHRRRGRAPASGVTSDRRRSPAPRAPRAPAVPKHQPSRSAAGQHDATAATQPRQRRAQPAPAGRAAHEPPDRRRHGVRAGPHQPPAPPPAAAGRAPARASVRSARRHAVPARRRRRRSRPRRSASAASSSSPISEIGGAPMVTTTSPSRARPHHLARHVLPGRHEDLALGAAASTAAVSATPPSPGSRTSPGPEDLHDHDLVGEGQRGGDLGLQVAGAVDPVRLEHHDQPAVAGHLAQRAAAPPSSRSGGRRTRRRPAPRRRCP